MSSGANLISINALFVDLPGNSFAQKGENTERERWIEKGGNKQYLRANAGYKICRAFTSQHAVLLLTRVVWLLATLMFCCDFWFKHNFARQRDRGRCCMKLYCTRCCHSAFTSRCALWTKRKKRKEKWKPEQSTKISYISSRDLHNFPFFSCPFPLHATVCVLHLNAWQINWQHYFHFLEFSRISIFHSSDFSLVFISDFCVNAAYD